MEKDEMCGTKVFRNFDPSQYDGEGWYFYWAESGRVVGPFDSAEEARGVEMEFFEDKFLSTGG